MQIIHEINRGLMTDTDLEAEATSSVGQLVSKLIQKKYLGGARHFKAPAHAPGAIHFSKRDRYTKEEKRELVAEEWLKKKADLVRERGHSCQNCSRTGPIELHHSFYVPGRKAWDYRAEDLLLLCAICHDLVHLNIREARQRLLSELRESVGPPPDELTDDELAWMIDRVLGYHDDPTEWFDEDNAGIWYVELGEPREFTAEQVLPWYEESEDVADVEESRLN